MRRRSSGARPLSIDGMMVRSMSTPSVDLHPQVLALASAVRDAGGRALLVGGWARELVSLRLKGSPRLPPAEELDFEVYGLSAETLLPLLQRFGEVNLVGESFAVY